MIKFFFPEFLLLIYVIISLIMQRRYEKKLDVSLIFIVAIFACCFCEETMKMKFFSHKHSASLLKIIPLFSGLIISRLMKDEIFKKQILMTCSILGSLMIISAKDFLQLFFATELMIIPTYWIVDRNTNGRPYFLCSIVRSTLFAIAIGFIYLSVKSTNFNDVRYLISFSNDNKNILIALFFIIIAFPIKFAFLRFSSAFEISKTKFSLAAIVYCVIYPTLSIVFYKITTNIFYHIKTRWIFLFMGLASIASFSAQLLFQNNLRKIITCVLMNYIGTIFLCCAFPCYNSVGGVIFLISSQVVSLLGIFFLLAMVKKSKFQEIDDIRDLCSLSRKHPFFALSTSILFLSFLGFPPFLGFFGKFYVCSTIIGQGLALVIYAISFISNLICMSKILDAIWFKKNNEFFIFDGSTERMIHAFACLTIVAVPLVYKILQLINTELYFA